MSWRPLLTGWLCVSVLGCAPSEARWVPLAGELERSPLPAGPLPVRAHVGGREVRLRHGPRHGQPNGAGGSWLETTIAREDWTVDPELAQALGPGVWSADVGLLAVGGGVTPSQAHRLVADGETLAYRRPPAVFGGRDWNFPPGSFSSLSASGRLLLRLEEGREPPRAATLSVLAAPAPGGPGETAGASGSRFTGRHFSGAGLRLWSGQRAERPLAPSEPRVLRFGTALEPAFAAPGTDSPPSSPVRFTVALDGRDVLEHTAEATRASYAWHEVALPAEGSHLSFRVEGPFAHTTLVTPGLGPAEVGGYGERPWDRPRPDVVVFLADTFRADNLAAYGSELGLTPHLDRLARSGLVFPNTWSTGTYTLPAHASIFGGVYPLQAGIVSTARALPERMRTLGEVFSDFGYRTGAITEGGMVSARLGMAQGFDWFDESAGPLPDTLARALAFLEADDGRPVLLFVHTYRTHLPYVVSPRTMRRHGEALGIRGDLGRLRRELDQALASPDRDAARVGELAARIRAHYLGGVADLDEAVGRFHAELVRRGLERNGCFVFTSDHGEAFGEHGVVYHTGRVWDELARVPLFLRGHGIEPGVVPETASLVDLPLTLATLAGLPVPADWGGRSLLEPNATGGSTPPVFVFECGRDDGSTLGIVSGKRKLIGYEDDRALAAGELFAAFDLASDPGETRNLVGEDGGWPAPLLEELAPEARHLLRPLVEVEEATLDDEKLDELRALGYAED